MCMYPVFRTIVGKIRLPVCNKNGGVYHKASSLIFVSFSFLITIFGIQKQIESYDFERAISSLSVRSLVSWSEDARACALLCAANKSACS